MAGRRQKPSLQGQTGVRRRACEGGTWVAVTELLWAQGHVAVP
eukprot:gene21179-biopygen8622